MKYIDWQLLLFVGGSILQETWLYWGFPKVYYWNVNKNVHNKKDDENNNIPAA